MKVATEWIHQTEKRANLTSSKGNQNKWCVDGVWYKADGLGYGALAEVMVSRLLEKVNIDRSAKKSTGSDADADQKVFLSV